MLLTPRLSSLRPAPLAPTNDRILFVGPLAEGWARVLRRLRPDTKVIASEGDRLGTFELGLEEGREAFVAALRPKAGADAVRAALAWARSARARLAELAIAWTTTGAVPSRLVVTEGILDLATLARALPEAGRQIEDLYLVGAPIELDALLVAFPNLRTVWTCAELQTAHLRLWESATRGRREDIAVPPWVRAQGVACWSRLHDVR